MKPTEEQIKVLLEIQHRFQIDPTEFAEAKAVEDAITLINNVKQELIDKACEWLDENLITFIEYDHLNGIDINYSQLYKQFRKAMEE